MTKKRMLAMAATIAALPALALACADSGGSDGESGPGVDGFGANGSATPSGGSAGSLLPNASGVGGAAAVGGSLGLGGSGAVEPPPLPDEVEPAATFLAPVATGNFLWSSNPMSGRVALIDVTTQSARILSAGLFPKYLTAIPGPEDSAAAINAGSSDVSLYRVSSGDVTETRLDVHAGANAWSVSASGDWAAVFSVPETGQQLDPSDGLQEITVLHLAAEPPVAQRFTVGYRPNQVRFNDAETRLTVVSEDGLSLLELGSTAKVSRWHQLDTGGEHDVSITADGKHALIRETEAASVQVLPLDGEQDAVVLEFSGTVTDLDLAASGRAVAVVRDLGEVFTFTVADVLQNPNQIDRVMIDGELVGSAVLSTDGLRAVLYTTAVPSDRISIVSLDPAVDYLGYRSISTKSTVSSISLNPEGTHAVVLGNPSLTRGAFSVVSLTDTRFPRVVGTVAPISQVALSARSAIVTASDANKHEAHLIDLPSLAVTTVSLASPTVAAGIFEEHRTGYVAQSHAEGRVTFFDMESGAARTLTGYELAADVVKE